MPGARFVDVAGQGADSGAFVHHALAGLIAMRLHAAAHRFFGQPIDVTPAMPR